MQKIIKSLISLCLVMALLCGMFLWLPLAALAMFFNFLEQSLYTILEDGADQATELADYQNKKGSP